MKNQIYKLVIATVVGFIMIGMVSNIEEGFASNSIATRSQIDYINQPGNLGIDPPNPPPDWPPNGPPEHK